MLPVCLLIDVSCCFRRFVCPVSDGNTFFSRCILCAAAAAKSLFGEWSYARHLQNTNDTFNATFESLYRDNIYFLAGTESGR